MPKAYSYIRFSTPGQARGDSLRRQIDLANEWCAEHGMTIDESLRDMGVSAHKGAQADVGSALGRFLALVEKGDVARGSYLIVESLDRLSRETVLQALPRFTALLNAGIVIVTLMDRQVYSQQSVNDNPYQLIVSLSVMARAHDESATKGVRVAKAWAKKREKAREGGHKMTRRAPEWLFLENGEFTEREERVDIVRRVFKETIEGSGRRAIASRLNLEGRPAFRGKNGWHSSAIAKILASRAVFGEFQPGTGSHASRNHRPDGEPIKGYYPVVVDEDTFWRAQSVIASRRVERGEDGVTVRRGKGGRRGHGIAHLLIGLGRCDRCKRPMHLINKGRPPKGALYLECSTAARKAPCENKRRWRVDAIERRLLMHLSYIDADAVLRGEVTPDEVQHVESLRGKLAAIEKQRDAVLRILDTSDEAAEARFRYLADEVKRAKAALADAEKALAQAAADPGLKARLADAVDLSRAMDEAEGEQRTVIRTRLAEQLRQLVEVVRFDPELGVDAVLRARPDIPADQVPFIYGATETVPWRLSLDYDTEPHGAEPWAGQNEPEVPLEVQMPGLARKLAERKAGAR